MGYLKIYLTKGESVKSENEKSQSLGVFSYGVEQFSYGSCVVVGRPPRSAPGHPLLATHHTLSISTGLYIRWKRIRFVSYN